VLVLGVALLNGASAFRCGERIEADGLALCSERRLSVCLLVCSREAVVANRFQGSELL